MCLFIHYPVSDKHTIICVYELVIFLLLTFLYLYIVQTNNGLETMSADDGFTEAKLRFVEEAKFRAILHTTRIHVLTLSFRINKRTKQK